MARVGKAKAVERLQKLLDEGSELSARDYYVQKQKFTKWTGDIRSAFYHIFGKDSPEYSRLSKIYVEPENHVQLESFGVFSTEIQRYLDTMVAAVASALGDVKDYREDDEKSAAGSMGQGLSSALDVSQVGGKAGRSKVFVIHGHDEAAREMVATFLEKRDLEPVILHEQPNKGRTIIEKFEDYADVCFVVALPTPDDVGASAKAAKDQGKPAPRARQNVIFELGFFIGKLGREKVCTLVKGDIETLSDYNGVGASTARRRDDAGTGTSKCCRITTESVIPSSITRTAGCWSLTES